MIQQFIINAILNKKLVQYAVMDKKGLYLKKNFCNNEKNWETRNKESRHYIVYYENNNRRLY